MRFDKYYPVITKFFNEYYTNEKYLGLDDKLLIKFKNPNISESEVSDFALRNNLDVYHYPSINLPGSRGMFTFIFTMKNVSTTSRTFDNTSIKKAAIIFENEPLVVEKCVPNLKKYYKPDIINDPNYPELWQINNTLQSPICAGHPGTIDADAQIDRVWNIDNDFGTYQGYTGQGVIVGLIDFHGFDFDHIDMSGQLLPGWNCITNLSMSVSTSVDPLQGHGMATSGIIAANANNNEGALGVAFGAKIRPYLIDGDGASEIIALQKCLEDGVDIINMSYGVIHSTPIADWQLPLMPGWDEINSLEALGRSGKGTIMIGAKGNDDLQWRHLPSDFLQVLSIAATTPDDHKKEVGDTWYEVIDWGSNYGPYADVSAPGYCMFTTDFTGNIGYNNTDYLSDFSGTSGAAPMVSGLAALLLEKEPSLTNREVYNAIMYGADKVGGYDYSFYIDQPGKSQKLAHGRINGYRTVSEIPNNIKHLEVAESKVSYISPFAKELPIIIDNAIDYEINVLDIMGNKYDLVITKNDKSVTIDFLNNITGIYFVNFTNNKTNKCFTLKVYKNE